MKFNKWSQKRISLGKKRLTSRINPSCDDKEVKYVTPKLPWWFIREFLYRDEGADSPEELQRVINQIHRRKVPDDKMLHVHVLNVDKHECSFGFGNGRYFDKEKGDWVCSCGRTRREYLGVEETPQADTGSKPSRLL